MIAAQFAEQVRIDGSRLALRTGEYDASYAQLLERAYEFEKQLSHLSGQQIGIYGLNPSDTIVGLLAADLYGIIPCLFSVGMQSSSMTEWAERIGLVGLFDPSQHPHRSLTPCSARQKQTVGDASLSALWLFTSGTTGPPQPVRHSWQALTSTVRKDAKFQNRRWLLAYDPNSFAGLQVMLQAILTGGTLTDVSQSTPNETSRRIVAEKIEFASGTPTFWRMLLGAVNSATWKEASIEQITLGGESVSEGTLAALKAAFPQARISHIYATSELGVCFSVSDAHAGFPASYLEYPPAGCQLRISNEGELEVLASRRGRILEVVSKPPTGAWVASEAQPAVEKTGGCATQAPEPGSVAASTWQATGDLVELRDDRVYFVGRKSGAILVGGGKVVPEEVEAVIRDVPGVAEVRISGQPSSVLGSIVRADVVATPDAELNATRTAILAACQAQLPRHKVPAMIEFHNTLPRTPSGKLARSVEATENPRPNP